MSRYDGSDFYCIPGSTVLRNLARLQTQLELDAFEADVTAIRMMECAEAPIGGDFDLTHLCRIHQHVFQDVYEWAGKLRMVDISKGDSRFANFGHIESYLGGVLAKLQSFNLLRGLEPDAFITKLTFYMSEINAAHPFREGNGRVQRIFCAQLADQAGYFIDFDLVDKDDILKSMIAAFRGDEVPLRRLLTEITSQISD